MSQHVRNFSGQWNKLNASMFYILKHDYSNCFGVPVFGAAIF